MTTPREFGSMRPDDDRLAAQLGPARAARPRRRRRPCRRGRWRDPIAEGSPYTPFARHRIRVEAGRGCGRGAGSVQHGERGGQEPRGDLAGDRPAQLRLPLPGGRGADEPVRGRAPRLGRDPRPAGRRPTRRSAPAASGSSARATSRARGSRRSRRSARPVEVDPRWSRRALQAARPR